MTRCKLCNKNFGVINNTHLAAQHKIGVKEYARRFGYKGVGFARMIFQLPKDDSRYKKWRQHMRERPPPWSKGYTKDTHPSVAKIAKTFKEKRIDNFASWREKAKKEGKIPGFYPSLEQNEKLAFLVGIVLGDGNIFRFPRTEGLRITLGTDKPMLWEYTASVMKEVFHKKPDVAKVVNSECMRLTIYQKHISERMQIPCGNRREATIRLPRWISKNRIYLIVFLRGLYEAEGSFNVHLPTGTYKMIFSNRNATLLDIVYNAVWRLGFHPHRSKYKIQISKKAEVYAFKDLIEFRKYT